MGLSFSRFRITGVGRLTLLTIKLVSVDIFRQTEEFNFLSSEILKFRPFNHGIKVL